MQQYRLVQSAKLMHFITQTKLKSNAAGMNSDRTVQFHIRRAILNARDIFCVLVASLGQVHQQLITPDQSCFSRAFSKPGSTECS